MDGFGKLVSQAYTDVISGKTSLDSAVSNATNKLLDDGVLKVTYPSGRKLNVASATSTNVRTTLKQSTMDITDDVVEQTGADYIEVSAHADCADDHLWLQGLVVKVGSRQYYDVLDALKRPNCRHSYMPFYKGISKKNNWGLPSRDKIKAQYALEQRENAIANEKRKIRMQQKVNQKALAQKGTASEFTEKTMTKVQKEIATKPNEVLVVFNKSGRAILDIGGNSHSVGITPENMKLIENGGYSLVHNHPTSGGSFSPADLVTVAKTNSLEIRAVDDEWVYIAKPAKGKSWSSVGEIGMIHQSNLDWAEQEISKMPRKEKAAINKEGEYAMHRYWINMAMEKTAKDTGIIYIRKKLR